ncbi:non-homologous end-joining DNA ligase [Methyloferula stellata]|uniref:non-homologous end-joining DNA ligase n=1 Tax=Methyloferula stellata TaxID=876270 RepID=UPI00036A92AF|nr:non-homologous end-joining DNA ligase [Methyloferula stellata]
MPAWVEPCKPTLAKVPPAGPAWLHEIKWDGYRVSAYLKDGKATVRTSGGLDWTRRFPAITSAVEALPVRSAIIDGEAVVLDEFGRSHFGDLQKALGRCGGGAKIQIFAFDLLYFDGMDLRAWPLENRHAVLEGLIGDGTGAALVISQEFDAPGARIFDHACRVGLEGIVSKRRDRPYRSGKKNGDWLKIKCVQSDTFLIIGYQPSTAMRGALGAIHVATVLADRLHYAGAVGTGFSERVARDLKARLDKLVSQTPIISGLRLDKAVWCRPELKAEIAYRDITRAGQLRHASFKRVTD